MTVVFEESKKDSKIEFGGYEWRVANDNGGRGWLKLLPLNNSIDADSFAKSLGTYDMRRYKRTCESEIDGSIVYIVVGKIGTAAPYDADVDADDITVNQNSIVIANASAVESQCVVEIFNASCLSQPRPVLGREYKHTIVIERKRQAMGHRASVWTTAIPNGTPSFSKLEGWCYVDPSFVSLLIGKKKAANGEKIVKMIDGSKLEFGGIEWSYEDDPYNAGFLKIESVDAQEIGSYEEFYKGLSPREKSLVVQGLETESKYVTTLDKFPEIHASTKYAMTIRKVSEINASNGMVSNVEADCMRQYVVKRQDEFKMSFINDRAVVSFSPLDYKGLIEILNGYPFPYGGRPFGETYSCEGEPSIYTQDTRVHCLKVLPNEGIVEVWGQDYWMDMLDGDPMIVGMYYCQNCDELIEIMKSWKKEN